MELLEERTVNCPYCGEPILLLLDCSVTDQEYTEDCPVCCRPMAVTLHCPDPDEMTLLVKRDDE